LDGLFIELEPQKSKNSFVKVRLQIQELQNELIFADERGLFGNFGEIDILIGGHFFFNDLDEFLIRNVGLYFAARPVS